MTYEDDPNRRRGMRDDKSYTGWIMRRDSRGRDPRHIHAYQPHRQHQHGVQPLCDRAVHDGFWSDHTGTWPGQAGFPGSRTSKPLSAEQEAKSHGPPGFLLFENLEYVERHYAAFKIRMDHRRLRRPCPSLRSGPELCANLLNRRHSRYPVLGRLFRGFSLLPALI
jgi:hypothetical protein